MNASVANASVVRGNDSITLNNTDYDYVLQSVPTCLDWGTGDAEAWVREAVRLLLSAAILLSNSFIVVAVLRFWARDGGPLGGRAASSFLVLNLAVADALMGLSLVYTWIQDTVCSFYEEMLKHQLSCMLPVVVAQFFDSSSAVTIIVIAVDRVMSVSHTARCRNFLTPRRALAVVLGVWLLGLFLALTAFMIPGAYEWNTVLGCDFTSPYDEIMFWGTVAVVMLSLIGCYCRIHWVTLQMLQRGSLHVPRKQTGTKAARMLLMIIAWDSCAYFPLLLVTLLRSGDVNVSEILVDTSRNLTLLTFLADPFIYAYHNPQTKKAIMDLVGCLRRGAPSSEEELGGAVRRDSIAGTSLKKVRQIISTITASSSGSDEDKGNKQSPSSKRNSKLSPKTYCV